MQAEPLEALDIESSERKNDLAGSARAAMVATGSWVVHSCYESFVLASCRQNS